MRGGGQKKFHSQAVTEAGEVVCCPGRGCVWGTVPPSVIAAGVGAVVVTNDTGLLYPQRATQATSGTLGQKHNAV